MARFWIGLLLGAALGFVLASLLAPRGEERAPTSVPPLDVPAGRDATVGEAIPGEPFRARGEGLAAPASSVTRVADDSVQAFLNGLPRPAVSSGSGAIHGRIRTGDGAPLPGVRIALAPTGSPPIAPRGNDESLAGYVRSMAEAEAWRRANRRETTSAEDGSFRFADLDERERFRVHVEHAGYRFEPRDRAIQLRSVRPSADLDLVAERVVEVRFQVLLPDGRPAPSATLTFETANGSSSWTWRPEDPTHARESGTYRVRATTEDRRHESRASAVAFGEERETIVLRLEPIPLITGHVRSEHTTNSALRVHLLAIPATGTPSPETVRDRGDSEWIHAGNGWAFRFERRPPGRYALLLSSHERILSDLVSVTFDGTFLEVDLEARPLRREDFVSVLVLDPEGRTIGDATITSGVRSGGGHRAGGSLTLAQQDGRIWVSHQEPEGLAGDARYFVRVRSHFGEREESYERTAASEVTVRFQPAASLEVTIAAPDARLLPDLAVTVSADADSGPFRFGGEENAGSEVHVVTGLQPGSCAVIVHLRADRHRTLELARQSVVLAAGKNAVTIAIPPLHQVGITFPEGRPGERVRLRPEERDGFSMSQDGALDANQRVVFDRLPAGRYRVSGSGREEMTFELRGSTELTFRAEVRNALRVSRVKAGSYAESVGLLADDLVIGVGEQEFRDEVHMRALFLGTLSQERATLLLLRGGRRHALEVDPRKLLDEDARGLDLRPTGR